MLRVLLLIAATLLLLGLPGSVVEASVAPEAAAVAVDGDCCPDSAEEPDTFDCCDYDFGACCAVSVFALAPAPTEPPSAPARTPSAPILIPAPPLVPLANGPPPTPPPIS